MRRIGDLVLSQNCQSGRLSYEPVVGLHHNSPMPTLRLRLGDEEIVSTTYHRFWRAGQGWAMARELELGDVLRRLAGRIKVADIQVGPVEPVFNLDVASNCTYFVGKNAVLVHDNGLPPSMLTPFDAEPELEAVAHAGRGTTAKMAGS
jgi:Pretoxin HINT domain